MFILTYYEGAPSSIIVTKQLNDEYVIYLIINVYPDAADRFIKYYYYIFLNFF